MGRLTNVVRAAAVRIPRPSFRVYWEMPDGRRAETGAFPLRIAGELLSGTGVPRSEYNRRWLRLRSKPGYLIPAWYGFAYRDFDRDAIVYYPISLNLIVAAYRWCRAWFKVGGAMWCQDYYQVTEATMTHEASLMEDLIAAQREVNKERARRLEAGEPILTDHERKLIISRAIEP